MPTNWSVERLVRVIEPATNGQVRLRPARKYSLLLSEERPPIRFTCHQVARAMTRVRPAKTPHWIVSDVIFRPRLDAL